MSNSNIYSFLVFLFVALSASNTLAKTLYTCKSPSGEVSILDYPCSEIGAATLSSRTERTTYRMSPQSTAPLIKIINGKNIKRTGNTQFSGDLFSLNFENIELHSLIKLIANFSKTNINIPHNLKSELINIRYKNTPWDEALTDIFNYYGLNFRVDENTRTINAF